jgi:hypothetical protein
MTMKSRLVQLTILGAALAFVLAGLTAAPRLATAKPEFAAQTKKACGYCHKNPGGGGPLNSAGEKFKANGNKL